MKRWRCRPISRHGLRATPRFSVQQESGTCRPADPWGGSYAVETLTRDLVARARVHLDEITELGGMTKAIEAGVPKLRIEEAAARAQARIDSGRQMIVGVNAYPLDEPEDVPVAFVSTIIKCGLPSWSALPS